MDLHQIEGIVPESKHTVSKFSTSLCDRPFLKTSYYGRLSIPTALFLLAFTIEKITSASEIGLFNNVSLTASNTVRVKMHYVYTIHFLLPFWNFLCRGAAIF